MRRNSIVAAATFILVISAPAFAQEWAEFAGTDDRFTCNFPGPPTITATTFRSQFGADLPARVYSAESGRGRYSVTVADYRPIETLLTERAKSCPAGAETCQGSASATSSTGLGYWKVDLAGALTYATWMFMQRGAAVTQLVWTNADFVGGNQLHLTNADKSRTLAAVHMYENKLYILEATVPAGYPEPSIFQQSLGWLDENGKGIRFQSLYQNGFPAPPTRPRLE
jgi:hypothetical protein